MTEYVLNVECKEVRMDPQNYSPISQKLFFQIDVHGNVTIKIQTYDTKSSQHSALSDIFILHDNIPIPNYMIEVFKQLLPSESSVYTGLYWSHYSNVIESIKICKQKIKEEIKQDTRLVSERRRRDNLLDEINRLEKQLETARQVDQSKINYLIRDNEKLKHENKELWESIHRKGSRQVNTTETRSWHNPGGADICTPSNAQNSMVYNECTGMYAPGND